MMPVEREFVSPDFVRLGTLLACVELIRSGVTCFADMYYFEEEVALRHGRCRAACRLFSDSDEIPCTRRKLLRGVPGRGARLYFALERSPVDHALRSATLTLYMHRRDPPGYRTNWPLSSTCPCTPTWQKLP